MAPKIATPISHLFDKEEIGKLISSLSDCLECRDFSLESLWPTQHLFHTDIQLIHPFLDEDIGHLKKIKALKPDLKLISFHIASNCRDPIIKDGWFWPAAKVCLSKQEMLQNAAGNVQIIRSIFGESCWVAIENNNYFPTPAYADITDSKFLADIVYKNDIFFLFDMAHALVTTYNRSIPFDLYINGLPLDRIAQIHISEPALEGVIARDAHLPISEKVLKQSIEYIRNYNIEYITVEYYNEADVLAETLQYLKSHL